MQLLNKREVLLTLYYNLYYKYYLIKAAVYYDLITQN
jgi:hypothetical protein